MRSNWGRSSDYKFLACGTLRSSLRLTFFWCIRRIMSHYVNTSIWNQESNWGHSRKIKGSSLRLTFLCSFLLCRIMPDYV